MGVVFAEYVGWFSFCHVAFCPVFCVPVECDESFVVGSLGDDWSAFYCVLYDDVDHGLGSWVVGPSSPPVSGGDWVVIDGFSNLENPSFVVWVWSVEPGWEGFSVIECAHVFEGDCEVVFFESCGYFDVDCGLFWAVFCAADEFAVFVVDVVLSVFAWVIVDVEFGLVGHLFVPGLVVSLPLPVSGGDRGVIRKEGVVVLPLHPTTGLDWCVVNNVCCLVLVGSPDEDLQFEVG